MQSDNLSLVLPSLVFYTRCLSQKYKEIERDPDQLDRYEHFRRSSIPEDTVKEVINDFFTGKDAPSLSVDVNTELLIMLQGLAKVYVGSLVETARSISVGRGESEGPLRPRHFKDAYNRLRAARSSEQDNAGQIGTGIGAPATRAHRLLHGGPRAGGLPSRSSGIV